MRGQREHTAVAIAIEPFLPGFVAPPCELVVYTVPTAEAHLVRYLLVESGMRWRFVVLDHVPTDQLSYGCDVVQQCAEPLEIAWQGSRERKPSSAVGACCPRSGIHFGLGLNRIYL